MNKFCITTFITENTPYEEVYKQYLLDSITKLNEEINHICYRVPDLGSWYKNTSQKPYYILKALNEMPDYDIVFLDADARVERYPSLFAEIPDYFDLAVHFLDRNKWYGHQDNVMELLSGTMFLRNNERIKDLVYHWKDEAERTQEWEQKVLQRVLKQHIDVNVYELPLSYCYINTLPNGLEPPIKIKEPVIVHYQVSRYLKKKIREKPPVIVYPESDDQ